MLPAALSGDAIVASGTNLMQPRLVAVNASSQSFDHQIDGFGNGRRGGVRSDGPTFHAQGRFGSSVVLCRMCLVVSDAQLHVGNRLAAMLADSGNPLLGAVNGIAVDPSLG